MEFKALNYVREIIRSKKNGIIGKHNDISKDTFKRSIVRFIVAFCNENNIISVAEGIETKDDLIMVRDLGVTCGQGFYLFKPTAQFDLEDLTRHPPKY